VANGYWGHEMHQLMVTSTGRPATNRNEAWPTYAECVLCSHRVPAIGLDGDSPRMMARMEMLRHWRESHSRYLIPETGE
jgi:hypothetical protein